MRISRITWTSEWNYRKGKYGYGSILCCGKCGEVVFREKKMVIGEGLTVLETELKPIDPDQIEVHKYFGYKQPGKIDGKLVIERVKKRIERVEQLREWSNC